MFIEIKWGDARDNSKLKLGNYFDLGKVRAAICKVLSLEKRFSSIEDNPEIDEKAEGIASRLCHYGEAVFVFESGDGIGGEIALMKLQEYGFCTRAIEVVGLEDWIKSKMRNN